MILLGYAAYSRVSDPTRRPDFVADAKNAVNSATEKKPSSPDPGKAAFTGGDQGFIDLKLASVETVNHNVKKFRFELPEKDQVSGLFVACTFGP